MINTSVESPVEQVNPFNKSRLISKILENTEGDLVEDQIKRSELPYTLSKLLSLIEFRKRKNNVHLSNKGTAS